MVLKKLSASLLLLLVTLTGCGGGGSTPEPTPVKPQPVSQFETPASIPSDKFRLAKIDYRYDTPTDNKDINGYHTTSFESVKPTIDKIKQIGFSGAIIQLQTPVNKDTGLISLYDQAPNDKTIPKDTWKLIDYAKSQGLSVWISLQIVDSVNDCLLVPDFKKFTEQQMFNNIITYQKNIATIAQQHAVDGIFISEGNYNLESYDHLFYWQQLISELRKVYSGKLSYTTHIFEPTSIWNHVDYASISLNSTLSTTPIYDLKSIINLYFKDAAGVNEVQRIRDFHMVYGKKFIITSSPILADIGVGNTPPSFWDNVVNNVWASISMPKIDKEMHLLKIRAFLEMIDKHLLDVTAGVAFTEFDPWLQHVNFTVPKEDNNIGVYKYYCCGFDLTNNLDAQKTINSYFSKPWGYFKAQ